ncbi:MAG: hypothetical protein ACTHU0_01360 [Kofleriaceae bacterium]
MDLEQVAIQFGLTGLVLLVGKQLATLAIERWGKVQDRLADHDQQRTDAIAAGFASLRESQVALATTLARLEVRFDELIRMPRERITTSPLGVPRTAADEK